MNDLMGLLDQMEKLPTDELERLLEYINTRPHKLENRKPTPEEKRAMITKIRSVIDNSQRISEEEDRNAIINAAIQDMNRFA